MGNNKFALQVNTDNCIACELCLSKCAFGALSMKDCIEIDETLCKLCGSCVEICPVNALEMTKSTTEAFEDTSSNIWVLAEVENNEIPPITLELIGKAHELASEKAQKVEVLLLGGKVSHLAQELIAHGADTVHIAEHATLENHIDEHTTDVTSEIIKKYNPSVLLVGATEQGRGISARLAAKLTTGLTADCTELAIDKKEGILLQSRPAFGGNLMATIKTPNNRPQMASVRRGIMKIKDADPNRKGEIVNHDISSFNFDDRITVLKQIIEKTCSNNLNDSKIIVGIGRGVRTIETVELIKDFAAKIGGVIAGSRAAVEAGLIDASLQVGQTGNTISPDLYIAIGISGQIQHTAAITGSKVIIAINSDANAPIFNHADYAFIAKIEDIISDILD